GETLGIIGRNGSGKSTLLKLISRVTAPTTGTIDIWGRVSSLLEVGTGFNLQMTGRENVYLNGAILGMSKAEIMENMDSIIEFSEIADFIDTPVKRYSSGMKVKLGFAVAAHLTCEIMIMDEVLAVGDSAFKKKSLQKLREAASERDRTVLYVSHDMDTVRNLCRRCLVLNKGRIVYDGETDGAIRTYLELGTK
ncbi:MAG: ABC transporter ATP-binding protein, partial [Clostridia bacterium]|nr:ABC transporter ATP-binding protein [Clostridia bacterium]